MRFRFAIVGAGLTGTSMLYQFVQRLAIQAKSGMIEPRHVHVRVFEKRSVAGPGFPHNELIVKPYHITNMCAQEMGILISQPGDFEDWIDSHRAELNRQCSAFRTGLRNPALHRSACNHYPRALMGEYLKARFADALRIAETLGARVDVHTDCEVTDITETERGASLCARVHASGSQLRFHADRILLATGHWPRGGSSRGYFATPWPAQTLIESIPPGVGVAVIGSSLSAIETALTLTSDGRFVRTSSGQLEFIPPPRPRRIVLLSRHGLLPKVRCQTSDYRPRYFTQDNLRSLLAEYRGCLTLESIFHLLDQEIHCAIRAAPDWKQVMSPDASPMELLRSGLGQKASGGGIGPNALWQSILRQAFPLVRELYLALSAAQRKRFDRDYATFFFAHAATQPPINAEKMLALLRSGVVRVEKMGLSYRFAEKSLGSGYEFVYGDRGSLRADFGSVVDARGQQRSVRTDGSLLIGNLTRNKAIHLGEFPSGQENDPLSAAGESGEFTADSVWIDTETHRVMQVDPEGTVRKSNCLYAVGAMTRGQIIDTSMARGLARSTDRIAEQLVDWLAKRPYDNTESVTKQSSE